MIMLGTMTGIVHTRSGACASLRRTGRGGGLLLTLLLLAGCPGATPGTTDGPGARLPTTVAPAVRPARIAPLPKVKPVPAPAVEAALPSDQPVTLPQAPSPPSPPSPASPSPVADAVPAPVPTAVPTAVPTLDPRTLVGLDRVQTRRLLGIPAATEEAPPAKVWRYAKGDCTLEVFFFMDMTSAKDFRALSYDMKSSQNVPDRDNRCFAQLVAQAGNVIHD